jgi:hypothetical protein
MRPTKLTSEQSEQDRDADLKRVARAAATEVVAMAAAAASQVSDTAAGAARVLAETTRLDLQYIKDDLKEIKTKLEDKYVTAEMFEPVRRLVYGMVGLILVSVVGGLLAMVLRH